MESIEISTLLVHPLLDSFSGFVLTAFVLSQCILDSQQGRSPCKSGEERQGVHQAPTEVPPAVRPVHDRDTALMPLGFANIEPGIRRVQGNSPAAEGAEVAKECLLGILHKHVGVTSISEDALLSRSFSSTGIN